MNLFISIRKFHSFSCVSLLPHFILLLSSLFHVVPLVGHVTLSFLAGWTRILVDDAMKCCWLMLQSGESLICRGIDLKSWEIIPFVSADRDGYRIPEPRLQCGWKRVYVLNSQLYFVKATRVSLCRNQTDRWINAQEATYRVASVSSRCIFQIISSTLFTKCGSSLCPLTWEAWRIQRCCINAAWFQ